MPNEYLVPNLWRVPEIAIRRASSALGGVIIALIGALVGLLVWRVACEVWIVIFSINDRLGQLVDRGT